jgi:hypothetical protein
MIRLKNVKDFGSNSKRPSCVTLVSLNKRGAFKIII